MRYLTILFFLHGLAWATEYNKDLHDAAYAWVTIADDTADLARLPADVWPQYKENLIADLTAAKKALAEFKTKFHFTDAQITEYRKDLGPWTRPELKERERTAPAREAARIKNAHESADADRGARNAAFDTLSPAEQRSKMAYSVGDTRLRIADLTAKRDALPYGIQRANVDSEVQTWTRQAENLIKKYALTDDEVAAGEAAAKTRRTEIAAIDYAREEAAAKTQGLTVEQARNKAVKDAADADRRWQIQNAPRAGTRTFE